MSVRIGVFLSGGVGSWFGLKTRVWVSVKRGVVCECKTCDVFVCNTKSPVARCQGCLKGEKNRGCEGNRLNVCKVGGGASTASSDTRLQAEQPRGNYLSSL